MAKAEHKAAGILHLREFLRLHLSAAQYEQFLSKLSKDARELFTRQILVGAAWVPEDILTEYFKATMACLTPVMANPLRAFGRFAAERDFKGAYKAFVRIASTSFALKIIVKMWNSVRSTGKAEIIESTPGRFSYRLLTPDFEMVDQEGVAGYVEKCMELTGAKKFSVKLTVKSPHESLFLVTWT